MKRAYYVLLSLFISAQLLAKSIYIVSERDNGPFPSQLIKITLLLEKGAFSFASCRGNQADLATAYCNPLGEQKFYSTEDFLLLEKHLEDKSGRQELADNAAFLVIAGLALGAVSVLARKMAHGTADHLERPLKDIVPMMALMLVKVPIFIGTGLFGSKMAIGYIFDDASALLEAVEYSMSAINDDSTLVTLPGNEREMEEFAGHISKALDLIDQYQ